MTPTNFLTTIYYLSTLIVLWIELGWLLSPIEKTNDVKNFSELIKLNKGKKKWNEFSEEYKSQLKSKLILLWVLIWMGIGLFTVQWVGFSVMLFFNFLIINPLSKLTKYSLAYTIIHWFNSLIGFSFGVFVIVNHYYLNIDLTELLLSFIR